MKSVIKKASLVIRLGLTGAVLLLSQQTFAAGTIAGTDIDNRATVGYSVNTVAQTGIESSPTGNSAPGLGLGEDTTFVVDNRVDFTVVRQDGTQVPIELGETDVATQFLLSNDGNEVQDFLLNPTQHLTGDLDPFGVGNDDTTDVASITAYVDDGDNLWDPLLDTGTWVDELGVDSTVIVWVSATGPATGVTGDIANINLEVTVADGNGIGGQGAATTQDDGSADDAATIQVVFADGSPVFPALGDGVENDDSGYTVESATLSVLKDSDVISDPFNGATNPKAIPGAVIEYSILVENTGTVIATDVNITDVIQLPLAVALATGGYNGGLSDIEITVSGVGGTTTNCLADGLIADGCTFGIPADTFVIGRPGAGGLTIPVGETATILYQVTIL